MLFWAPSRLFQIFKTKRHDKRDQRGECGCIWWMNAGLSRGDCYPPSVIPIMMSTTASALGRRGASFGSLIHDVNRQIGRARYVFNTCPSEPKVGKATYLRSHRSTFDKKPYRTTLLGAPGVHSRVWSSPQSLSQKSLVRVLPLAGPGSSRWASFLPFFFRTFSFCFLGVFFSLRAT